MEEKDELVNKFIKLAYKMASPYCKGFPKSSEDIKAAALEGLCRGVNKIIKTGSYEHAGAIIYLFIRGHILDEVNKIPFIRIPISQIKRKRLEAYQNKELFKIRDLYPEVYNDPDLSFSSKIGAEGFFYEKIRENVEAMRLNKEELDVLNLRFEEQTVREMAIELGCSKSQIHKILERIRAKWRKRCS